MPNDIHNHNETVLHFHLAPDHQFEKVGDLLRITPVEEARRVDADPTFTRDEATAQVRRALAIGGRVTWDEAIAELYRRTQVNRKGWISGWGEVSQVSQLGHTTFYGEVKTELCGGVPMVYLLLPEIEATDTREGLPEQEVFFPLATLYRFTPTAEHEVIDARRAQAPLKMETRSTETTRLRIKASDEAEALYLRLLSQGRPALTPSDIDKLTPENPAPSVYDEDVPF